MPMKKSPKSASELLDMYYLDVRSHLLETAAALDRLDRAADIDRVKDDPRLQKLKKCLEILKDGKNNRAEEFLKMFSEK